MTPPRNPPEPSWPPERPSWLELLSPINVLKWASVIFVIAMYVLLIVSIVLALVGVH